MDPPWGFLHATQWVFLRLPPDWFGIGVWSGFASWYLIRHLTLVFLALISVLSGISVSLRNTMLFLVFHMLQMSETTLSIWIVGFVVLALDNLCRMLFCAPETKLWSIQLWETANLQHSCEIWQWIKRWPTSSLSVWQKGHRGSRFMRTQGVLGRKRCMAKLPLEIFLILALCQVSKSNYIPILLDYQRKHHERPKSLTSLRILHYQIIPNILSPKLDCMG